MLVMDTGVSLLFWARSISARSPYLPFVDSFTFSPSLSSFLAVSRNPSLFPSILLGFTFVEYHPSFVLSSHELTYAVKSLLLSAVDIRRTNIGVIAYAFKTQIISGSHHTACRRFHHPLYGIFLPHLFKPRLWRKM